MASGTWRHAARVGGAPLAIGVLLIAPGCALKPEPTGEQVRAQMLMNATIPEKWSGAGGAAGEIAGDWIETFHDSQLQALVKEALAFNSDLRAGAARVEEAAAYVTVARGR